MGGIIHTIIFFCFGEQIFRDSKINQKFPSSALGLDKKKIWRFPLIDFFFIYQRVERHIQWGESRKRNSLFFCFFVI